MNLKKIKLSGFKISIGITIVLSLLYSIRFLDLSLPSFMEVPDHMIQDFIVKNRKIEAPHSQLSLVTIDQDSADEFGRWPWKRKIIANLLTTLNVHYQTRVIGLTLMFPQSDINDKEFQDTISEIKSAINLETSRSKRLEKVLDRFSKKRSNDKILSRTLSNQNNLVMGYNFFLLTEKTEKLPLVKQKLNFRNIFPSRLKPSENMRDIALKTLPVGLSVTTNIAELNPSPQNSGFLNLIPEKNNDLIRKGHLLVKADSSFYPSFALQVFKAYQNIHLVSLHLSAEKDEVKSVQLGKKFIYTDSSGAIDIHYGQIRTAFDSYSVSDIINRRIPKDKLSGRIVLIGSALPEFSKTYSTIGQDQVPEMNIQAQIIQNIIDKTYFNRSKLTDIVVFILIIFFSLYLGFILPKLSFFKGTAIVVVLFVGIYFISSWLIRVYSIELNIFFLLATIVFNYAAIVYWIFYQRKQSSKVSEKQPERPDESLAVSEKQPETADESFEGADFSLPTVPDVKDPTLLISNQESQNVTILYSDMKPLLKQLEWLSTATSTHLRKFYFKAVSDIIFKFQGTLVTFEKYTIVAYWVSNEEKNSAIQATTAALEILTHILTIKPVWKKEYSVSVFPAIGLSTGEVSIPKMEKNKEISIEFLEALLNRGKQIHKLNRTYKTAVLMEKQTYHPIKPAISSREIDILVQPGSSKVLKIYEPICLKENRSNINISGYNYYLKGLKLYREKSWKAAIKHFEEANKRLLGDPPSILMIKRCQFYIQKPPSANWKGVSRVKE